MRRNMIGNLGLYNYFWNVTVLEFISFTMSERQHSLGEVVPLQAKRKGKKWKIRYNIISPRSSVQIKILVSHKFK